MKKNVFTLKQIQDRGLKIANDNGFGVAPVTFDKDGKPGLMVRIDKPKPKIPKEDPAGLSYIKGTLRLLQVNFETEYSFLQTRKFRFDIAIVSKKIAIEYEGIFSDQSRHTGFVGYVNDCRKYNLAQTEGWKVLRYTAKNYKEFYFELKRLIPEL